MISLTAARRKTRAGRPLGAGVQLDRRRFPTAVRDPKPNEGDGESSSGGRGEAIRQLSDAARMNFARGLDGHAKPRPSRSVAGSSRGRVIVAKSATSVPDLFGADEQSRKFWRLARRSLQISRSMKDNREATDAYIADVLSDPYEDGLNRSFHLEYYRDHKSTGMSGRSATN